MTKEQSQRGEGQITIKKHLKFDKPLSFGVLDLIQPENKREVNQFNKRYGSLLATF